MGNSWNDMWTVLWIGYRLIIYNYNRGSMETQIQTDMPRPSNFFNGAYGHFILTLKHQDRQSQVAFTLQIIQSDQQMGNQYTSKAPFSPSINRGYSHFTHPSLQQTSFFWVSHCFPVFIPLKQWLTPRRFSFWVFYSLLSSSSPLRCRPES